MKYLERPAAIPTVLVVKYLKPVQKKSLIRDR